MVDLLMPVMSCVSRHTEDYDAVFRLHGLLGEEPHLLHVRGTGSYDGKHEALVNVWGPIKKLIYTAMTTHHHNNNHTAQTLKTRYPLVHKSFNKVKPGILVLMWAIWSTRNPLDMSCVFVMNTPLTVKWLKVIYMLRFSYISHNVFRYSYRRSCNIAVSVPSIVWKLTLFLPISGTAVLTWVREYQFIASNKVFRPVFTSVIFTCIFVVTSRKQFSISLGFLACQIKFQGRLEGNI